MSSGAVPHNHVAIIGIGFGGIATAVRLRKGGVDDLVLLERAGDLGGVWRDNDYSGAAVDVQSHLYSFSFAPNPDWRNTFAKQPESHESRISADKRIERALAVPVIGDLVWTAATDARRRNALRAAFAPRTPIPTQFVANLRATGRRRLVAASRAIDTYLAHAPLAARLAAAGVPAELIFGEHDARIAPPPSNTLTHIVLPGVGHKPPWEAPDPTAALITTSVNGGQRR